MNNLTVSLVQSDLAWQNAAANREELDTCLAQITLPTDLIVLPEMFSTGFSMEAHTLAEDMDGPTVAWMQAHAAAHDAVVTGSLIIREKGRFYNRLLWVRPDGTLSHYDKRHLFSFAGEQHIFTPGQQLLVEEWRGWRICPLVCYDLRFPVWSRNSTAQPYDLLVYVASWPAVRRHAWTTLLRARAIENVAFTLGVNRTGRDGLGHEYVGDSALIDMRGEYLLQAGNFQNCISRTLSASALQEFRNRFPALEDSDSFHLTAPSSGTVTAQLRMAIGMPGTN